MGWQLMPALPRLLLHSRAQRSTGDLRESPRVLKRPISEGMTTLNYCPQPSLPLELTSVEKHNREVGTPIDADILKYHVIEGKKSLADLNADQKTLNGGTLTSYRKFRKNWLDDAVIGLKSEGASKGMNWPADVACDNGVIHAIDTVLVPGAYGGSR